MYTQLFCWSFLLMTLSFSANAMDTCPKMKPATGLKISEILGTWYAVRGIEHGIPTSSDTDKQAKSCPLIKILMKDDLIEFQWHAKDAPLKKLDLKENKDKPGLLEPVNKKKNSKNSLQITILNDSKNVIGITMCKYGGRSASVILNREAAFVQNEVQSITNILSSQGLNVNNIFDRCV